ncbi:hypothetical protein ACS0TY_022125 [Phlomoides rotata]
MTEDEGMTATIRSPKPPNPQIGSPKPQIGSLTAVFVDREFDHQVRRSEIEGGKAQIYQKSEEKCLLVHSLV